MARFQALTNAVLEEELEIIGPSFASWRTLL
jgi:hypothetical protein